MDIITIYNYYTIINGLYLTYSVLSYSYKIYKTGKVVKKYIYKEKKIEDDWIILDLLF